MQGFLRRLVWPSRFCLAWASARLPGWQYSGRGAVYRDSQRGGDLPAKGNCGQLRCGQGVVSIDSQAIPGFMGAMTMPYKLAQPGVATELHPGDHINARLSVSNSGSVIDQIVVTAQAKPDYKPSKFYNVPENGQAVPDFKFLNQSGKTIAIDQFRGKVLLVTFIYTRCPLPDFCIRMSRNFATIEQQLAADPQLYKKTHLLSVSFDPAYDTPKVLRAYGGTYAGKRRRHFRTGTLPRRHPRNWMRWSSSLMWA